MEFCARAWLDLELHGASWPGSSAFPRWAHMWRIAGNTQTHRNPSALPSVLCITEPAVRRPDPIVRRRP
eukprot:gene8910-biopygen8855